MAHPDCYTFLQTNSLEYTLLIDHLTKPQYGITSSFAHYGTARVVPLICCNRSAPGCVILTPNAEISPSPIYTQDIEHHMSACSPLTTLLRIHPCN